MMRPPRADAVPRRQLAQSRSLAADGEGRVAGEQLGERAADLLALVPAAYPEGVAERAAPERRSSGADRVILAAKRLR